MTLLIELAGWGGMTLALLAFALVSFGKVKGTSLTYQGINLASCVGLGVNGFSHGAWPSVGLNVIWAMIGIAAICVIRRTAT